MSERFFKTEELPNATRIRNNIYPSLLFPSNAKIRAGDLELQVISVNDRRDTVTLKLTGIFVKPVKENPSEEKVILVPQKPKIIKP